MVRADAYLNNQSRRDFLNYFVQFKRNGFHMQAFTRTYGAGLGNCTIGAISNADNAQHEGRPE